MTAKPRAVLAALRTPTAPALWPAPAGTTPATPAGTSRVLQAGTSRAPAAGTSRVLRAGTSQVLQAGTSLAPAAGRSRALRARAGQPARAARPARAPQAGPNPGSWSRSREALPVGQAPGIRAARTGTGPVRRHRRRRSGCRTLARTDPVARKGQPGCSLPALHKGLPGTKCRRPRRQRGPARTGSPAHSVRAGTDLGRGTLRNRAAGPRQRRLPRAVPGQLRKLPRADPAAARRLADPPLPRRARRRAQPDDTGGKDHRPRRRCAGRRGRKAPCCKNSAGWADPAARKDSSNRRPPERWMAGRPHPRRLAALVPGPAALTSSARHTRAPGRRPPDPACRRLPPAPARELRAALEPARLPQQERHRQTCRCRTAARCRSCWLFRRWPRLFP
jgi:hypothetical protein